MSPSTAPRSLRRQEARLRVRARHTQFCSRCLGERVDVARVNAVKATSATPAQCERPNSRTQRNSVPKYFRSHPGTRTPTARRWATRGESVAHRIGYRPADARSRGHRCGQSAPPSERDVGATFLKLQLKSRPHCGAAATEPTSHRRDRESRRRRRRRHLAASPWRGWKGSSCLSAEPAAGLSSLRARRSHRQGRPSKPGPDRGRAFSGAPRSSAPAATALAGTSARPSARS